MNPAIQKRVRNVGSTAICFAELCSQLNTGRPKSRKNLCELVGVTEGTICRWIRLLRNKKLIYISKWERPGLAGNWVPCFAWGIGEIDAERPKAMSQREYDLRARAKKRKNFKWINLERLGN